METHTTIESLPCLVCNTVKKYTVTQKQYDMFRKGRSAFMAFPQLTMMEIESLISGICSDECWEKLFNEDQKD